MQIKNIFDKMDYGEAPESAREAQNWLKNHNYTFGNFINRVAKIFEGTWPKTRLVERFRRALQRWTCGTF